MKRIIFCLISMSPLFMSSNYINAQQRLTIDPVKESLNHDISLSPWGPYSKRYAGISHVADMKSGIRFDFTVCPAYYRNNIIVPNVNFATSYIPWKVSPDMKQLTYRYEMEWKDQVYTDVTYYIIDSSRVLVEMNCVNNTDYIQDLTLNTLSFINYPENHPGIKADSKQPMKWINAVDYDRIDVVHKTPQFRLVNDGYKYDEVRSDESLDGSLLAGSFGNTNGDEVSYAIDSLGSEGDGMLIFRYRVKKGGTARFQFSGVNNDIIVFPGTGKFEMKKQLCKFSDTNKLTLRSVGNTGIELDGFFITSDTNAQIPQVGNDPEDLSPIISGDNTSKKLILKYRDVDTFYGMAWDYPNSDVREVLDDELDIFFRLKANDNVAKNFTGNKKGDFTNLFLRPIEIKPRADRKIYVLLCSGTESQVKENLEAFNVKDLKAKLGFQKNENDILPAGKKYEFGNQLLQAALLSNIVYPIYTQRQYIRHFTPGKQWNSLYTWDEGFISLGMMEVDLQKSFETLNAYTTQPGNQSAFIHHGSMVPVQFFDFFELWNRTQSKVLLEYMYPRLKQYYQFMIGEIPTSDMRKPSNLLSPWDYFYNSGGWDDYPAQKYLHDHPDTRKSVTPVITTAQCIRISKIMRLCATVVGLNNDIKEYDNQIQLFTDALQKYSWDQLSGYFSYVVHDAKGLPQHFFTYPSDSSNFNMGLDGVSPLISGICTPDQQKTLVNKLFSHEHLWTPFGITAVDQSASYFRQDGYWNGTVWMPHQWFMWKSLLDMGEGDRAFQIAHTALELWKRETSLTYHTFEHFISSSGRGAGWPQFSGLSCPVLNWFAAYYKIGHVTTGFETWIENQQFNDDFSSYRATLLFDETSIYPHQRCMLICMNPGYKYEAYFNNKKLKTTSSHTGFVQIYLPEGNKESELRILIKK